MLAALAEMWTAGARFMVAGRREGDAFRTLDDIPVPPGFESIFSSIPEVAFRDDISSSEIRERETPGLKSERMFGVKELASVDTPTCRCYIRARLYMPLNKVALTFAVPQPALPAE